MLSSLNVAGPTRRRAYSSYVPALGKATVYEIVRSAVVGFWPPIVPTIVAYRVAPSSAIWNCAPTAPDSASTMIDSFCANAAGGRRIAAAHTAVRRLRREGGSMFDL